MGRDTLYTLLAQVAFLASSYALQISMARWLPSAADYGRFGVLLSIITLARTVLSTGIPQAVTRFVAAEPGMAEGIYRRGALLQLTGAAIVWITFIVLTPLLARFFGDQELGSLLLLASPLLLLMAFYQVNLGYISGKLRFGFQAQLTTTYSIGRYVVSALLVLGGLGVSGAVCGQLISTALVALLSYRAIPRSGPPSSIQRRQFLNFSWPLVLVSFGISALLNLDLLLLGRHFPASDSVGFYSGAVNLGKAPYFVLSAVSTTTMPVLARLHAEGELAELRRTLSKQLRFLLLGALPSAGLLAVTSAEMLPMVYGKSYAVAAPALSVLALSSCTLSVLVVLASAITACAKPHLSMLLVLICLPAQALFGTLLIAEYGMLGAAASNVLATSCGLLVAALLVHHEIGSVWSVRPLASALVSTGASIACVHFLPHLGGLWLFAEIGVGVACYALMLWLTGGVTSLEVVRISRKLLRAS